MPTSPPFPPPSRQLDVAAPGRSLLRYPPLEVMDASPAPRPTRPSHLLVVERDQAMRFMLAGMLAGPAYDVEAVGSNLEAGQAVERRRPDLVLLDLYLREPDGMDFVRALRASPVTAELPVILLTASADLGFRADDRASRIERVLFKPFGMKELLETVRSALARSAAARDTCL